SLLKKMIQILKCFIISFFIIILIISLAGMYKFNYLANKEGYDPDGNKIDIETLVPISNTFEHDKIYEGIYSWGHEVHSFTPCNSKTSYWVGYHFAGHQMNKFYKENHKKPYQSMYIKFRGHTLNEKVDGFAEQYDGLIHISEVKNYSFDIPRSCASFF
ncbi:MAG: hypothetical protein U9R50_04160, partial [Campylobacterota bacterium]|nr:hypothetical protein [Campylobacterota bacterium]